MSRQNSPPCTLFLLICCIQIALLGCGKGDAVQAQKTTPAPSSAATQWVSASVAPGLAAAKFYSQTELDQLGFKTIKISETQSLLCSKGDEHHCVCLQPLPCEDGKNCVGLKENIDIFRAELAKKEKGRKVHCDRAEYGQCGDFQYFLFNGDIERHELRWFTKDGKLVAQRNFTDYNAWCDGRARKLFTGKIPICQATERKELFCGKAENPVPNALDDLR